MSFSKIRFQYHLETNNSHTASQFLHTLFTFILHRDPVDGRKAINGLALLVEQALGLNPFDPTIFVFSNRRRDRVKLLLWDRTGFWLMVKRLEADRFRWPKDAAVVTLTVDQLHWLLAGIDLAAMRPHPVRNYTKVG